MADDTKSKVGNYEILCIFPPHISELPYLRAVPLSLSLQTTQKYHNAIHFPHLTLTWNHHFPPPPPPAPPEKKLMFSSLMATKLGFALTTAPRLFASSSRKPLISPASLSSASSCSRVESFQLVGRQLRLSRRLFIISPKATADQQG